MNAMEMIARAHSARKAAGLCVSYDRTTPEETAAYGRATRTVANIQDRDACVARLAKAGRNPRIEY